MYRVNDIFFSIQGEGLRAGTPTAFVRFAGCNLHCSFCDTQHQKVTRMSGAEILRAATHYARKCRNVVFTGGEPTLQLDEALLSYFQGWNLAIETNGTQTFSQEGIWTTVSPKVGSKVVLEECDEIKYVLADGEVPVCPDTLLSEHHLISPMFSPDPAATKRNIVWCVKYVLTHPKYRLSVQLHKLLEVK